jgi:hypothetical protein
LIGKCVKEEASIDHVPPTLQLRFALPQDPFLVIDAQACNRDPIFKVVNNRTNSIRYSDYHCHIEFIVPDNILMPEVRLLPINPLISLFNLY